MLHSIDNERLAVAIDAHGAELRSIRGHDGIEYLWQGDPAFWSRRAPVLFPIVGRLRGDRCRIGKDVYSLEQHGFARDSEFELVVSAEDRLRFELASTPESRESYPFDFVLAVEYRLARSAVAVTFEVTNSGREPLPFSIGAHPAFSCRWAEGDSLEDFFLEFEQAETVDTVVLEDGLLSAGRERLLEEESLLPLRKDLFDRGALVLLDHRSRTVSLGRVGSRRRLAVSFPGFPHLGIWSK
ncbi:MAG: aldose 1-epimerase family protein, partial [Candidatus Riflebacteria bacterium]|nr:aldose 1-epimerase family protein [Candidatus Riflebacteria bacterium]